MRGVHRRARRARAVAGLAGALLALAVAGAAPPTPPTPAGRALFPVVERGRWGFIDVSGQVIVPLRFESLTRVDEAWRVGQTLQRGQRPNAAEIFMSPTVAPETTEIVGVRVDGRWGFAARSGDVLPPRFDQVGPFAEGLAPVRLADRWGFANTQALVAVPCRFLEVAGFRAGFAIVNDGGRFGVIDSSGRPVLRARFDAILEPDTIFRDNRARVALNERKGYAGVSGNLAIPPMFDEVGAFSDGLAPVTRGGVSGYIDTTGRWVISRRFRDAARFRGGIARVQIGNRYGYIDRSGTFLAKPEFDEAEDFDVDGRAVAWKDRQRGHVDRSGRWTAGGYDAVQRLDDTLALGVLQGRHGLYDRRSGTRLRDYPYPIVGPFAEGLARALDANGLFGFIDVEGRMVIPPRFEEAVAFTYGLCKVAAGDSLGYIDTRGSWVWVRRLGGYGRR